jgi:hypothetical protein
MYLEHLVAILDGENKNWRRETVIFWDNASYHTSKSTKDVL